MGNDISSLDEIRIGILVYEGFDSLDVAGPNQVFFFMKNFAKALGKEISISIIAPEAGIIQSFDGFRWEVTEDFCSDLTLDMIFVPGGNDDGVINLINQGVVEEESNFFYFLQQQVKKAEEENRPHLVTSVCTGALLLATAGLLDGYKCTTHWAFRESLTLFSELNVAPGFPRYVVDRNRVTGGGISSGLDEALAIVEIIVGEEIAKEIQLIIQYAPNPPFQNGDPSLASPRSLYKVSNNVGIDEMYDAVKKITS